MTKKHVKAYLLWTLGLAVLYFLALLLSFSLPTTVRNAANIKNTTGGYGDSLLRYKEADGLKSADVLFLGSSHTYREFDPRIFAEYGIDSFNLGSSNQTPLNTYYLLKAYIDNIDVDVIVMETFWGTIENPDGNESTIDLSSNMEFRLENLEMAFASQTVESVNSTFASLVAQKVYGDSWLDSSKQTEIQDNYYVKGGYVETRRRLKSGIQFPKKAVGVSDKQLDYLERIAKLAESRGIKIVFVRTPVPNELVESITNYQDTTKPLEDLALKHNTSFIDFNATNYKEELNLNLYNHFYDQNHLNDKGVKIFNEYYAPILKAQLDLAV